MKIDNDTRATLKILTNINASMIINKDEDIYVVSPCSSVIGYAKLENKFEEDLSIYDMKQFLSVLSLFDEPSLEFSEDKKSVIIGSGTRSVKYFLTEKEFIKQGKELTMPEDSEVLFDLPSNVIDKVMKASAVMGLDFINISSEGKDVTIGACSVGDDTANNYSEKVADGNGSIYNFYMKSNKVILPSIDYKVTCSSRNICEFKGDQLTYWIGLETTSEYKG